MSVSVVRLLEYAASHIQHMQKALILWEVTSGLRLVHLRWRSAYRT